MKTTYSNSPPSAIKLGMATLALMLGVAANQAYAAGTASGTNINNLAKLSYSVGGIAQNEICSSTTGNSTGNGGTSGTTCTSGANGALNTNFVVDNKVILTVAKTDAAAVAVVPGQTTAVTTFTVTNNGNTVQDYALSSAQLGTGTASPFSGTDNFDAAACNVFVESGATAGYQVAQDTEIFVDELAADASKTVYAVCNIPAGQLNGDQAVVSLTATTENGGVGGTQGAVTSQTAGANTAGVDVVFADVAGSDEAARDGKHSARDAYLVASAVLSVAKVVTPICDPFNGNTNPKNIPGAYVQYAITVTNTSSTAATLTTVTDTLASQLGFDTKLISGVGAPAATACSSSGTSLAASGFGAVTGAGATTYAAPGSAAQATTAGATIAGQDITINYSTLATGGPALLTGGSLPGNSFITVYFNSIVQ